MANGFFEIAQTDPPRCAVIDAQERATSYGELHAYVNRISNGLRAVGLGNGHAVAIVLPSGLDFVACQLATAQAGMYLVPINWHFTSEEIGYILKDCSAGIVIAAAPYAAAVRQGAERAGVRRLTLGELAGGQPPEPPADRRMGSVMLYTSGTTGRPKGVRRRVLDVTPEQLHAILARRSYANFGLPPGDGVHLVNSPMYHSAPYAHALMSLQLGHTVVITERFEPRKALELVERYRVTNTFMVPTMFHRLLALPAEVRAGYDVSSLRHVFHSAAPCPVAVKRAMLEWLGPVIYEYYGSTEAAIATLAGPSEWLAHPGTVGRPLPGYEVVIMDSETGAELPRGEQGMVYIQGMSRFAYHGDPQKTAASMRGSRYSPGDIGYLDSDGYLYICDRRTDLIISGGVNIYPAEIEAALLEHEAVADVAVIGVPDEEWGQRIVALIQPAAGVATGPALTAELLAHCEPRLARLKHPRVIEFRTSLPRTPTGKLSRSRVRSDYLQEPA